ncbi:hypothetical protein [Bdellovibrio sp. BCCA]|uniref:hypothetical protein n=1 Tax=Bdellovibrio sp. BCCA TaxID=3136281 RepID=UPI0030EFC6C7
MKMFAVIFAMVSSAVSYASLTYTFGRHDVGIHSDSERAIQDQIMLFLPEADHALVKVKSSLFGTMSASVELCSFEEGQEFCSVFPDLDVVGGMALRQADIDVMRNAISGPKVVFIPTPASRYFKQQM